MLKLDLTMDQEEMLGKAVAKLLSPKTDRKNKFYYLTKTNLGLGRVLVAIIEDIHAGRTEEWIGE